MFISIFLFIVGTTFGSFFNVLADRLSNERTIGGRSECESCHHILAWYDLVPFFSFLILGARCRYCKTKLSFFYPFSEVVTGLSFSLTWLYSPVNITHSDTTIIISKIVALGIVSCLLVILFADIKYQIIPDPIQLVLLLFSFAWIIVNGAHINIFIEHLVGGFVVMIPLLLIFIFTRGRGMGFGDVKLAFTIGFLLGILNGLLALYIAFISGAIVGVVMIAGRMKKLKSKIAFGPFLVFGIVVMFFYGEKLVDMFKRLYLW
jgi:prepilin signal peptidase PulO-like enzyme (type II secretory pathway)